MKKHGKLVSAFLALAVSAGLFMLVNSNSADYATENDIIIAMNTMVSSTIYSKDGDLGDALSEIENIVNEVENQISWRIETTELAILNETGDIQSEFLSGVLTSCLEVSVLSSGSFDVSIGELTQLWDIGGENENLPSEEEISAVLEVTGYENISIDDDWIVLDGDVQLDLGAIGKGLACDEIKTYLETTDISGAIVSVGGSVLAYGSFNDSDDPWQIAVQNPRDENAYIGVLRLDEGFISTSGDYERYFELDGIRYHHILDANTGYPSSSDLISVTVVADSGLLSDALSTAIFACGSQSAEEILDYFGASAILIDSDLNVNVIGDLDFELL
ncbi:MAG: FAD:protein FMN transferase [Clostridia bacterium]